MRGLTAEDLVSVIDVLVELLPEFADVRIVRPWALPAAAAAAEGVIAGIDVHDPGANGVNAGARSDAAGAIALNAATSMNGGASDEERMRALAVTIRRLKPLDRGNAAFAVTAVLVHGRLLGEAMSLERAAAIAGARMPGPPASPPH
ncbi:hypothetical protein CHAN_00040 [Corynebacterium hansenii]|nr:hypothetical protein CHAN_00040 [Corynebacterium hansenii]